QRQLEAEYARYCQTQPAELSDDERKQIRALARDIPQLWHAGSTGPADRQRIIRLVITRVVVHAAGNSDRVAVLLEWAGGFRSVHDITRPVRGYRQQADFARLIERVRTLHAAGQSNSDIAEVLNREGFHPVTPRDLFDR